MSPEFQSTLTGSDVPDTYSKVAYYSKVTIRHMGSSGGGYLHSHRHFYPAGSKQQQITCYPFRDLNSDFLIKPPIEIVQENNDTKSVETTRDGFVPIRHGDIIRLEHMSTQRRLHSHEVRPTISDDKEHNEASGYGEPGFLGDTNDHWRVEFVDRSHASLKAMSTKFRLVHVNTGCKLFSHALKLPEWGETVERWRMW